MDEKETQFPKLSCILNEPMSNSVLNNVGANTPVCKALNTSTAAHADV